MRPFRECFRGLVATLRPFGWKVALSGLLGLLEGVPCDERTARFVTVITMILEDGEVIVARGECPGHIAEDFLGEGGFGYDPVFVPEGYSESFAQMGTDAKNRIGHRARALEKLTELLTERGL